MQKELIGQATDQQIAEWKQQNALGILAVKKDGRIGYFKYPGFKEIDFYHDQASRSESISDSWKALAEITYIGGDRTLIESPKYLPAVSRKLSEAVAGADAELVNL